MVNSDNLFDSPPTGYTRIGAKRGWALPAQTPQTGKLHKLKKENLELKDRLAILEEAVATLVNKKGKK